jgi:hypothetical protein
MMRGRLSQCCDAGLAGQCSQSMAAMLFDRFVALHCNDCMARIDLYVKHLCLVFVYKVNHAGFSWCACLGYVASAGEAAWRLLCCT